MGQGRASHPKGRFKNTLLHNSRVVWELGACSQDAAENVLEKARSIPLAVPMGLMHRWSEKMRRLDAIMASLPFPRYGLIVCGNKPAAK